MDRGPWRVTVHGVTKSQTWQWLTLSLSGLNIIISQHLKDTIPIYSRFQFYHGDVNFQPVIRTIYHFFSKFSDFVCIVLQFFYAMSLCRFLSVYPAWGSLELLGKKYLWVRHCICCQKYLVIMLLNIATTRFSFLSSMKSN